MLVMNRKQNIEIGDLIIMNTGSVLGKMAYKVTRDILHVKLENIENGFEYDRVFQDLDELQEYISLHSHVFQWIPLH